MLNSVIYIVNYNYMRTFVYFSSCREKELRCNSFTLDWLCILENTHIHGLLLL